MTTPLARPFIWLLSFFESSFIQLIFFQHIFLSPVLSDRTCLHTIGVWFQYTPFWVCVTWLHTFLCLCKLTTHLSVSVFIDYTPSESVWLNWTSFCVCVNWPHTFLCLCKLTSHLSESVWLDYTPSVSVWLDYTPFCVCVKIDYTPFWAPASSMAAITVKADTDLLLTNRLDTKCSARFLMSLKFCSSSFIAHSMTRSHDARYRWLSSVFSSCCKPIDIHLYKYWKPHQNVKKKHGTLF